MCIYERDSTSSYSCIKEHINCNRKRECRATLREAAFVTLPLPPPPCGNKLGNPISTIKVTVKVTMSLTLVSIERDHGEHAWRQMWSFYKYPSQFKRYGEYWSWQQTRTKQYAPIIRCGDIQIIIKCDWIKEQGISMFILKISLIYFRPRLEFR